MLTKNQHPDNHVLDPVVKNLKYKTVLFFISLGAISAGIILSVVHKDWSWINRFGSIVIVAGLFFTMSPIFSSGIYKSQSHVMRYAKVHHDGTLIITTAEERENGSNVALGIVVTVIGTLTNAFGDLLGNYVYSF